ncbi:Ig-like domain-containing surface protein [Desulfosporosinus acidiphilus SJ4]|uniref:Ig-like domain-containing surface protein n=1 Tax=Desulfosporosinus acidiphilus (strain DSM 22704 / JCM 16185 / SJ4) TaxID=646529 RepID=I4DBM0_DESAJ|nr:Ig-like domain-containing protein [Desulfosporosinus acidiphilus]AFM43194.1 Ig-like domain-containing surface protein [Desulfosporosinus acidiphilus SJ4]
MATVDAYGRVKGIALGSANITAKSDDGGLSATCAITVQTGVTKIVLSKTADTINVGNNDTLVATITPSNATNQAVTWKSSNPSVATVDQNGKVVAVKTGTTVISVATQDGNKVASCQVTVPNLASSIALNLTSTTIDVGFTQSLNVVFTPSNTTDKKVTWSSDNTSVATVDAYGRVKGIALGSANITAKSDDGGLSAACAVTVQTGVTKIVLSKTTDTINVGNNDTLVAAITPGNATNQAVTWKSSNPSVATVDQNGKVVAVKTGTTVISVATQDGNKVASCQVTVPNLAKGISVNPDITTVNIGVTKTLSVTFRPSDTTDKKVTWSSDNPSVATVDAYGRVKGIAEGSANITATSEDGGFTSTCALLVQTGVTKITLNKTSDIVKVGNSDTLVATITPSDATNQNFTWKSSNPSVATVDTNGNVTAIKPGRAVITVTSEDGNKTASCSVTVIYLS